MQGLCQFLFWSGCIDARPTTVQSCPARVGGLCGPQPDLQAAGTGVAYSAVREHVYLSTVPNSSMLWNWQAERPSSTEGRSTQ